MLHHTRLLSTSLLALGLLALGCHGVSNAPKGSTGKDAAVKLDSGSSSRSDGSILIFPSDGATKRDGSTSNQHGEAGGPLGDAGNTRPGDARSADGVSAVDAPQSVTDAGPYNPDPSLPDPSCLPSGAACSVGSDCCAGSCDPVSKTCMSSIAQCLPAGYSCTTAIECCNLSCTNGKCAQVAACLADNQACTSASACCSGSCQNGTCQPLNAACKTAGNPCTSSAECCSHGCSGGKCSLAVSYCIQTGDICFRGSDCCSGNCTIAAGHSAGVCSELATTGSGSCAKDGTVCQDCTNCCSALCAPYARSGVKICQPASGCRVTNNLCTKDSDCCGGDPKSGLPGAGNVTCTLAAGTTPALGTCRNPQSCNPQGGICGLKSGATAACTNAREDCCDCQPPKYQCCKPDSIGVPRCYGGSTKDCPTGYTGKEPCCIHGGERCTFSAECCNGVPCVPGSDGVLRCMVPPTVGPACVISGAACTTTADCCAGMTCNIAPGAPSGICGAPPKTPPSQPTPDSGVSPTPDSGTTVPPDPNQPVPSPDASLAPPDAPEPECALYGQSCSDSVPCCDGVTCYAPGFVTRQCLPGELGCSCHQLIF